jgi:putative DNA primase/helicase
MTDPFQSIANLIDGATASATLLGERVRLASPADKFAEFARVCRLAIAMAEPGFNRASMADRLHQLAECTGVMPMHSVDEVQQILADVLPNPGSADAGMSDEGEINAPPFSEEALALRFAERHADRLRYVAAWSKWLEWDGVRWKTDDTLDVFNLARQICREAAESADNKYTNKIASAHTVAAVERLARSDRSLAATIDQWDANPWLLNTPGGIVDLQSGKIRASTFEDYATKVTGIAPNSSMPTPVWKGFLQRAAGGDQELISFLQRVSGYALTGTTREHALIFIYGRGANGKTTFLNALSGCWGDYHRTSPIETFTASQTDRHPTELASLFGARLVTATETEEGRRWAESKIKSLTGGDRIAARFMRQDFFEFTPQFKLVIAGNYKPGLRGVDEAMRRRFHLISFTVTVPLAERDETLPEKLKAESPGILWWAIKGCLEWQRLGLAPSESVRAATAEYLEAEDAFAAWIEEECDADPNAWESTADLFVSWNGYASRSGEYVGSLKRFRQRLEDRPELNLRAGRSAGGLRGFYGLRTKRPTWNEGREALAEAA